MGFFSMVELTMWEIKTVDRQPCLFCSKEQITGISESGSIVIFGVYNGSVRYIPKEWMQKLLEKLK